MKRRTYTVRRWVFDALTVLGAFLLIGSFGAFEAERIGWLQALIQVLAFLSLTVAAYRIGERKQRR